MTWPSADKFLLHSPVIVSNGKELVFEVLLFPLWYFFTSSKSFEIRLFFERLHDALAVIDWYYWHFKATLELCSKRQEVGLVQLTGTCWIGTTGRQETNVHHTPCHITHGTCAEKHKEVNGRWIALSAFSVCERRNHIESQAFHMFI